MGKKIAIVLTHGMGDISKSEFEDDIDQLSRAVEKRVGNNYSEILFKPVYFQDILQDNQNAVFKETKRESEIDWIKLRKFMLFSFSDAASLEHRAHQNNSVYCETQKRIFDSLVSVYDDLDVGSKNVIVVAHSLGCQVMSNYIWDSQSPTPTQGIWTTNHVGSIPDGSDLESFVRLKGLKTLLTTGCNIPVFVAGRNRIQSIYTSSMGYSFEWHNFYDEDDVLGWPMRPLGKFFDPQERGVPYYDSVTYDHEINANGSLLGMFTKSWNPFSHGEYWQDKKFIKYLAGSINDYA